MEGLIHGGLGLGHIFSNIKSSSLFVSGNYSLTNKSEDSGGTSLLTYRNVYIGSIEFSICQRRLLQKKKNNNETSEYVFVNNIKPETSSSTLKTITFEEFTLKKQRLNNVYSGPQATQQ